MRTTARAVAVLVVFLIALAGCGGNGSDGGSGSRSAPPLATPSAEPADGDTITTEAFTYVAPKTWKKSDKVTNGALTLAIDADDKDGFSDNFNVVRDDTVVGVDAAELEDALQNVLKGVKATDISVEDRIAIDGDEAVHIAAIFEQNGTKYRTEQYAVDHGEAGYVLTVSFNESTPAAQRNEVSESILATWKWAS